MGRNMGEGSGENGVFSWGKGKRRFVLIGVIVADTLPKEARSKTRWVPQDYVQWPRDKHGSGSNLLSLPHSWVS